MRGKKETNKQTRKGTKKEGKERICGCASRGGQGAKERLAYLGCGDVPSRGRLSKKHFVVKRFFAEASTRQVSRRNKALPFPRSSGAVPVLQRVRPRLSRRLHIGLLLGFLHILLMDGRDLVGSEGVERKHGTTAPNNANNTLILRVEPDARSAFSAVPYLLVHDAERAVPELVPSILSSLKCLLLRRSLRFRVALGCALAGRLFLHAV